MIPFDIYSKIRAQRGTIRAYLHAGGGMFLASALLLAVTVHLESTPPLWWDEGWTLMVARTWVERGHYGRLFDGQHAPPGLEGAFPVTAPVALSFRLFGVGIWQGRLVGVACTLGTLVLMYYLAQRLYQRAIAIGTLAVLLLMSPMHPIIMGRQVLGEMPALLYLLAGYASFLLVLRRSLWLMPVALGLWGIALVTKLQVAPFWMLSLVIPLGVTIFRRYWRSAALLATGLIGSFLASRLLLSLQQLLLQGHTLPVMPIHGLYEVTALVPVASVRIAALKSALIFGLPTLLALCYVTWKQRGKRGEGTSGVELEVMQLMLLTLAGSWLAWYLLLSVGWPRYLFPATFIGSLFVAVMLCDLTERFRLSATIEHAGQSLRYLHMNRQAARALLAIMMMAIPCSFTLYTLYHAYVVAADTSVLQVAHFLNTQTTPDVLVETYDSELLFLVERRHHYPPDQIHVELNRRTFLGRDVSIEYDPLAAKPDYLVIGSHSKAWRLYDPVLATGAFRLVRAYDRYDVYERVR